MKAALGDIAKGNEMKSDVKVMANASDNIDLEGELSQPAARFTARYDKKKQRVKNATVYYQIKDKDLVLESAVLKKLNAFIAKFEDKKNPLTFSALWRVKSPYQDNEPRNYWYSGGMHRWISISTKETKSLPDRAIPQHK